MNGVTGFVHGYTTQVSYITVDWTCTQCAIYKAW